MHGVNAQVTSSGPRWGHGIVVVVRGRMVEGRETSSPNGEDHEKGDVGRKAGRGGLLIAAAKIYFMVVGLVQQIALKHLLGLSTYGALGRVLGAASIVYNPVVATAVQGVSRAVSSADEASQAQAQRQAITIHGALALPLAALFALGAPWLADLGRAPHLTTPLRIVSLVLVFYGLYTPLVGALNGKRRFGAQAGLDVCAATLRTCGLLGGGYLLSQRGLGVEGALAGFAAAAALMVGIALPLSGLGKAGGGPTTKAHLAFIAPLFGGQLALNLLLQSDMQLLGRFAADAAVRQGQLETAADTLAGAYRNAQLFCFLPYQLLLSVTFVLFPLLAAAHRDRNDAAVASYVRTGVRLSLILAGAMVSVTAGLPRALLTLVFGTDSANLGASAMHVMAVGLGAFAIFGILVTVLTSLGREGLSAILTVVALALVVGLCAALLWDQPFGAGLLMRTAIATAAGLFLATVGAAIAVKRIAGAVVSPATLVRVVLAIAIAATAAHFLPPAGKLVTPLYAIAVGLIYAAVLVATRELGREDARLVARVLGRG